MSKKPIIPEAKGELDKMKMEVANESGLSRYTNIKNEYLGNITTQNTGYQNVGNVGGEMVKRMIRDAEVELAKREGRHLAD